MVESADTKTIITPRCLKDSFSSIMSSQLTQLHEKINQPGNYLNNVINYYRFVLVESQPVTDPQFLFCWNHAENHNVLKLINIIIIVLLLLQG